LPPRRHPEPAKPPSPEAEHAAVDAGLAWVSDAEPGIRRRRCGRGFRYLDPDGAAVTDARTLARIRALAVPPAYTDVWICARANGHLQATGRDARGRKQYRYHAQWQRIRGKGKFDRIAAFGRALPRLRRRLRVDLGRRGFPRRKVLAMVVAIMADTLARVGNEEYAQANRSYGLTTLRSRHVTFPRGGRARFSFAGKGGQRHEIEIDDPRLVKLVHACQELPGQALFQYRGRGGALQPVDSGGVNDYLREAMGEVFTAKDFRTWGGTLRAFRLFAGTPPPEASSERALARLEKEVVGEVARSLGNTPAVCRRAYIAPAVFEGWRQGRLGRAAERARGERQWEAAALAFLQRAGHR
jgi:DNA topoisomerase IB